MLSSYLTPGFELNEKIRNNAGIKIVGFHLNIKVSTPAERRVLLRNEERFNIYPYMLIVEDDSESHFFYPETEIKVLLLEHVQNEGIGHV